MGSLMAVGVAACVLLSCATAGAEDLPDQYREPFAKSYPIRERQHLQMKAYLDSFPAPAEEVGEATFTLDFSSPEAYERSLEPIRAHLKQQAGWPPPKAVENPVPRFELVAKDQVADIYRVWTEVFEGVEAYGMYMVPRDLKGKAPVIIAVHGGSGCPEAICDLDTRINYHSFGREACKHGYIVYAPGLLMAVSYADPPDKFPEGVDYRALGELARQKGTSTNALQVYQIIEGTKAVVKARPEADGDRVGMTGLSMGGMYTLGTVPLSPMIKVAVPSAGFGARGLENVDRSDVTKFHTRERMSRAELAALICPRPLMIQSGEEDTVVPLEGARRGLPFVRQYYEKLGVEDRIVLNVHGGGHVFENEAIFAFFDKHLR